MFRSKREHEDQIDWCLNQAELFQRLSAYHYLHARVARENFELGVRSPGSFRYNANEAMTNARQARILLFQCIGDGSAEDDNVYE